ncbi:potassium transporter Kup [Pelomyxa schiedti]|nr:potassium transporter Kup [Pelomyxa schiedti]
MNHLSEADGALDSSSQEPPSSPITSTTTTTTTTTTSTTTTATASNVDPSFSTTVTMTSLAPASSLERRSSSSDRGSRSFEMTSISKLSLDSKKSRPKSAYVPRLALVEDPEGMCEMWEPETQSEAATAGGQRISTSSKVLGILSLTLGALGVVFGDIGTSPLYVFSTLYSSNPPTSKDNLIGACSVVIWSLIIIVALKYAIFVLIADNDGEGGVFALGGLLRSDRSTLPKYGKFLVGLSMMAGAGLLLGDGALTPAVSVLGAVGGLSIQNLGLDRYITPICIGILLLLFMAQVLGTSKIGVSFGPIIFVWFISIAMSGLWRITQNPSAMESFNPWLGIHYIFSGGGTSFLSLSSTFLAVTGVEALFADIGHFGTLPIRIGCLGIAMPAVILQYLGQTALLIGELENPDNHGTMPSISNPFYYTIPDVSWVYWGQVVLATMAAIIASQAIISGSFSMTNQAINLGFCPPFSVYHTSRKLSGQLYVPLINTTLLIASVGLVVGFGTSVKINNAYGFSVCSTMILTTILYTLVIHYVWGRTFILAILFMAFLVFDLLLWGAVVVKIPEGGWVSALGERLQNENVTRCAGAWIFFNDEEHFENTSPTFEEFVRATRTAAQVLIFISLPTAKKARIPLQDRIHVSQLSPNIFSGVINTGFMEHNTRVTDIIKNELVVKGALENCEMTVVLGQERPLLKKRKWYIWLYSWPLVVYSELKKLFPQTTQHPMDLSKTITISIPVEL